jgi:hypothetical protein
MSGVKMSDVKMSCQNVVTQKCRGCKMSGDKMSGRKNVGNQKCRGSKKAMAQKCRDDSTKMSWLQKVAAPQRRVPMVSVAYKRPRKDIGLSLFKLVARRAAAFPSMSIFVTANLKLQKCL